jgi:hypothetical protein
MPFVFGIVGLLLVVSGVRGQTATLAQLVKNDFTGQPNYLEWMFAIFLVGAFGYVPKLAPISRMFMVLIIVGLFLADHGETGTGFFAGLVKGVEANPNPSSIPQQGTASQAANSVTGALNQLDAINTQAESSLDALQQLDSYNSTDTSSALGQLDAVNSIF